MAFTSPSQQAASQAPTPLKRQIRSDDNGSLALDIQVGEKGFLSLSFSREKLLDLLDLESSSSQKDLGEKLDQWFAHPQGSGKQDAYFDAVQRVSEKDTLLCLSSSFTELLNHADNLSGDKVTLEFQRERGSNPRAIDEYSQKSGAEVEVLQRQPRVETVQAEESRNLQAEETPEEKRGIFSRIQSGILAGTAAIVTFASVLFSSFVPSSKAKADESLDAPFLQETQTQLLSGPPSFVPSILQVDFEHERGPLSLKDVKLPDTGMALTDAAIEANRSLVKESFEEKEVKVPDGIADILEGERVIEKTRASASTFDPAAESLQELLAEQGAKFASYGIDGKFGSETLKELQNYQQANYLPISNSFDQPTVVSLVYGVGEAVKKGSAILHPRKGSPFAESDFVGEVQEQLNLASRTLGEAEIDVDGKFGGRTSSAIETLQERLGLEAAGLIDARLLALFEKSAEEMQAEANHQIELAKEAAREKAYATLVEFLPEAQGDALEVKLSCSDAQCSKSEAFTSAFQSLGVDFGSKEGVLAFQKQRKIQEDGIIGEETATEAYKAYFERWYVEALEKKADSGQGLSEDGIGVILVPDFQTADSKNKEDRAGWLGVVWVDGNGAQQVVELAATKEIFERFTCDEKDGECLDLHVALGLDDLREITPATRLQISRRVLDGIKHFEGFEPVVKPCPAGVPTLGFGHVRKAGSIRKVTMAQAERLLDEDIRLKKLTLDKALGDTSVSPHFYEAMLSAHHNLKNFTNMSIMRLLRDEDCNARDISLRFLSYHHGAGRPMPGLMRRRCFEMSYALGLNPDYFKTNESISAVKAIMRKYRGSSAKRSAAMLDLVRRAAGVKKSEFQDRLLAADIRGNGPFETASMATGPIKALPKKEVSLQRNVVLLTQPSSEAGKEL